MKTEKFNPSSILIVDDDHFHTLLFQEILKPTGFQVTHANNGQEALTILKDRKFDLIFMDLMMPLLDGRETARQIRNDIRKSINELPIVALTSYNCSRFSHEQNFCFMNACLPKPVRRDKLFQVLQHYLKYENDADKTELTENDKYGSLHKAEENKIDLTKLYGGAYGDKALVMEIIQIFLEETPRFLENLSYCIEEGDHGMIEQTAHKYLSVARIIGLAEMRKDLEQIETLCDDFGELNKILLLYYKVQKACTEALDYLKDELDLIKKNL